MGNDWAAAFGAAFFLGLAEGAFARDAFFPGEPARFVAVLLS